MKHSIAKALRKLADKLAGPVPNDLAITTMRSGSGTMTGFYGSAVGCPACGAVFVGTHVCHTYQPPATWSASVA